MDSDIALLTTNDIPEINVDELERLLEGEGGDSSLARFCQRFSWESGEKVGDDGGSRLSVDGRDPETPPDSNQADSPTPPDIIGISSTASEMPRTVVEQAIGLLLAQQSLATSGGTMAYAYPFVQEVEINSTVVADSSQLVSEDGCGDLPVAGDLISEDGEEADRLAANTAIQQRSSELTGSGNEYYTVTAETFDEAQGQAFTEGFAITYDDSSLVEQSGRHSDQTVCDDDIEMLAMEGKERHCQCGLVPWEENGEIEYHKFVVNRRRISDSGRSFDSCQEEEDSGMDCSETENEARHSNDFDWEGPAEVGHQDAGAFSEDFQDQEAEGWEEKDEEPMHREGERPMQEEETESHQPVILSKEEPFPGLEEEPADDLVEDAELFLGSSEAEVAPSFPPGQNDLEDLVEDLVEETVEVESEAVKEVLVDQGPADAVPTVAAAAPPAVTHVAETSSGSLLDTITHDEAADKEQLATREDTVEAVNAQDEPDVPFSVPSQSQPTDTAVEFSSSNVSITQDIQLPPDMARCDHRQIVQSHLSEQELQVASVGSAECTVIAEPLKEQDGNVDRRTEEAMEEPAVKVQSVSRKRGRSKSHKVPAIKKPKRHRSPSPEIPLPKPRAAAVAQPAALEGTMSLAVAQSEAMVEPAEDAVTRTKGAKGQRQSGKVAEATAKPKLKKVVIGPITKEDVDAFVIHNKADVCSHHSLLGHPEAVMDKKGNLTFDFRTRILDKMPAYALHEILSKMPKSATEIDEQGNLRLKVDAMTNKDSKFKSHLKGYQARLRAGEYDSDVRRVYYEHAISNLDPWKMKNFEPMYGMIMDRSYKTGSLETLQQELAAKVAADQQEVQVREDENEE